MLLRFTLRGDTDLDGDVGGDDLLRLRRSMGGRRPGDWSDGDFDYDGRVNLNDFNLLAAQFGQTVGGPSVTPADWAALASAVPEPAGLVASFAVIVALSRRVRAGCH